MAYSGYLLKVGGVEIPLRFIQYGSYKCSPQQRIELTANRDNNGYLHRETVENMPPKVEFTTPPIKERDLEILDSIIASAFTNVKERKVRIKYFDHFAHAYMEADCYVPDIEYTIDSIDDNTILYEPVRYAFIGY